MRWQTGRVVFAQSACPPCCLSCGRVQTGRGWFYSPLASHLVYTSFWVWVLWSLLWHILFLSLFLLSFQSPHMQKLHVTGGSPAPGTVLTHVLERKTEIRQAICEMRRGGLESWTNYWKQRGLSPTPFSLSMLLAVTGNWVHRGSPKVTWPPRAGARIEHTSLVAHPGLFPLLVQNILSFCVLGQDFSTFGVSMCTCICMYSPTLLFSPVDPVAVTECLSDTALCDHETLGAHIAGVLVWCPGLCAG